MYIQQKSTLVRAISGIILQCTICTVIHTNVYCVWNRRYKAYFLLQSLQNIFWSYTIETNKGSTLSYIVMCINTTLTLAIEYGLERLPPLGTAQHGPCQSPVNRTLHSRTRAQLHDHHVSLSEWGRAGNVNTAYMYKKDCMYRNHSAMYCIIRLQTTYYFKQWVHYTDELKGNPTSL